MALVFYSEKQQKPTLLTVKKIILLFTFYTNVAIYSQIKVSSTTYSVEELIEDILISGGCAEISNIKYKNSPTNNGIGYFEANNSGFELASGIILSTGNVNAAVGPNIEPSVVESTLFGIGGDADLENAINDLPEGQSYDAIYIEFDFVPQSNFISFDFLFASEEYIGNLPCIFSDAFAFLLEDSNGTTTNLAVIPNTNIPISVTAIHPNMTGTNCSASNAAYFDKLNGAGAGATAYNGKTVVFKAESDVIPNEKYSIKLVIADAFDNEYDSAVFLLEGSFNLGGDLGDDLTLANGNALCNTDNYDLSLDLSDQINGTYSWLKLNKSTSSYELLSGQTNQTLNISSSGTYKVVFDTAGNCDIEDTISVEFIDSPTANTPTNIFSDCVFFSEQANFELTNAINEILGTQNSIKNNVSFHLSQNDADTNSNSLPLNYSSGNKQVYARIENKQQNTCYSTTSFQLIVSNPEVIEAPFELNGFNEDEITVCVSPDGTLINPLILGENLNYTYKWSSDKDTTISSFTDAIYSITNITSPTEYHLQIIPKTNTPCEIYSFKTTVIPVSTPGEVSISIAEPTFSESFTITVNTPTNAIGKEQFLYQLNNEIPQTSNVFYNVPAGDYSMSVIAKSSTKDCGQSYSEPFKLISFPRFFTPNGDGKNDTWNIDQLKDELFIINIFDRYGKFLKSINPQTLGWDGVFAGKSLPSNDYWFQIEYKDLNASDNKMIYYDNHFTLKR